MKTIPTDEEILPGMSDAPLASLAQDYPLSLHMGFAGGTPAIVPMKASHTHSKPGGNVKPFAPAVKPSPFVKANMDNPDYASRYQQCVALAVEWPLIRLERFYKAEYNSLRSRKQQAKSRHIKFDDRLKDFRDWLIHLGPRPAQGWTVHRMNNNKGYQPGNLKWATKIEQTEIRKVTKWHDIDGKKLTTKQLAVRLGITYLCAYKRLQNGWTIQRLLDAEKKNTGMRAWQFPDNLAYHLEPLYLTRKNYYTQTRLEYYIAYLKKMLKTSNLILPEERAQQELLVLEVQKAEKQRDAFLKEQDEQAALELQLVIAALSQSQITASGTVDSDFAANL